MAENKRLETIIAMLPPDISSAVRSMNCSHRSKLREIRLRTQRPLAVTVGEKSFFLSHNGELSQTGGVNVTKTDVSKLITAIFRNSVYSYRREITAGYMTIAGGCRAGFCGNAVLDEKNGFCVESVKDISSVNIRITSEIKGCAQEIFDNFGISGLLLAGGPCSGKTTYLRDLARLIGENNNVSLIDERNEIAGVCMGEACNDVGKMTDVFTSYNKYEGIISAVRSMNPKVLICDEIGTADDLRALEYAVNSGVKIIASCHCSDLDELYKKPVIRTLIEMGAFECAVMLSNGKTSAYKKLRGAQC